MLVFIPDVDVNTFKEVDEVNDRAVKHHCITRADKTLEVMTNIAIRAMRNAVKQMKELEAHE